MIILMLPLRAGLELGGKPRNAGSQDTPVDRVPLFLVILCRADPHLDRLWSAGVGGRLQTV